MHLHDIANEASPELRWRLLDDWIAPYVTPIHTYYASSDRWVTTYTWKDQPRLTEEEADLYDSLCRVTILQLLLGDTGPAFGFIYHPDEDVEAPF